MRVLLLGYLQLVSLSPFFVSVISSDFSACTVCAAIYIYILSTEMYGNVDFQEKGINEELRLGWKPRVSLLVATS